jgi:hypothetical protein
VVGDFLREVRAAVALLEVADEVGLADGLVVLRGGGWGDFGGFKVVGWLDGLAGLTRQCSW